MQPVAIAAPHAPTVSLQSLPEVTAPAHLGVLAKAFAPTATPTATTAPTLVGTRPATVLVPTRAATLSARSPLPTPTPSLQDLLASVVVVQGNAVLSDSLTSLETTTISTTTVNTTTRPAMPPMVQPRLGPPTSTQVTADRPGVVAPPIAIPVNPDGVARTAKVPILMYHYLSVPPADADIYRRDLSVAPELFAAHLDRLQSEGYTTISLYDLIANLLQGQPLPAKPVIITFDDGYRDNYDNAFPLLQERGMTATFFVVIDFINQERPEYMTWDMVRALYAGGMSVEPHGLDHTSLRNRAQADLEFQALRSYETLRDRIGVRPRFFSYPAGEYDGATIAMLQSADYWAAVTTQQGSTHSSDDLFELRRIRIRGSTTPEELSRLVALDW
ncbi:MAG: polysaccharide deacetylase family protein [Caldilineaceae bacterium]